MRVFPLDRELLPAILLAVLSAIAVVQTGERNEMEYENASISLSLLKKRAIMAERTKISEESSLQAEKEATERKRASINVGFSTPASNLLPDSSSLFLISVFLVYFVIRAPRFIELDSYFPFLLCFLSFVCQCYR